ncbi:hypothetical protein BSAF29S_06271 [Bacillus safensis subsp. safensis]
MFIPQANIDGWKKPRGIELVGVENDGGTSAYHEGIIEMEKKKERENSIS